MFGVFELAGVNAQVTIGPHTARLTERLRRGGTFYYELTLRPDGHDRLLGLTAAGSRTDVEVRAA